MLFEASVLIRAPKERVWRLFTDLTCWADWNSVLKDATSESNGLEQGKSFRCSIRPFVIPIYFEPVIEELVPLSKVIWRGSKFGITALHEYLFEEREDGVLVTSRETFSGNKITLAGAAFSEARLQELTELFLYDLKKAAEGPDAGLSKA